MPSFDVISKINYPEFDNALANCLREIGNRYDFKGLKISIERKDKIITTLAPDELKLKQVNELLQIHLIRRKVDPRVLSIKSTFLPRLPASIALIIPAAPAPTTITSNFSVIIKYKTKIKCDAFFYIQNIKEFLKTIKLIIFEKY